MVDDNLDAGEMLALILRRAGHDARSATSGFLALAIAREFIPQVVVLDVGLPDMSGYDVARALRRLPGLDGARLVALTGYALPEHRRQAEEVGFSSYFDKPLDVERLLALLRQP